MENNQTFPVSPTEWRELFRCYLYLKEIGKTQILPDYIKESLSIIDSYR